MAEIFRTPDERFESLDGYAFEPHYAELRGDLDGLRMHHLDEGEGAPILLLHGEPTWAYLYRKMIPALVGAGRVVVPDLIGFGRSDKPTDRAWYSYDKHCAAVVQLIEALDLSDITIVVQDWGGPIGLRVAVENEQRFAVSSSSIPASSGQAPDGPTRGSSRGASSPRRTRTCRSVPSSRARPRLTSRPK